MDRFLSANIEREFTRYCASEDGLYVLCPFISTATASRTLGRRSGRPTTIVTSWRFDYLLHGVSSLDLYPVCKENGWTLYINNLLHAKLYSVALRSAWIGSANLTDPALGATDPCNIEALFLIDPMTSEIRRWVLHIVAQARLVTDELHAWYVDQLSQMPSRDPRLGNSEPEIPPRIKDPFLISQLPASSSPQHMWQVLGSEKPAWDELVAAEHDLALYQVEPLERYDDFTQKLAVSFFDQPFVKALAAVIDTSGMRFGAVKEWVQKTCTDVPVPYRKLLTPHVQGVYAWFVALAPEKYEIFQPNVSEVIRRVRG